MAVPFERGADVQLMPLSLSQIRKNIFHAVIEVMLLNNLTAIEQTS